MPEESGHIPPFLLIRARQIEHWAEKNIEARQLLPVLLRRLAHSTGCDLRRVDFPGYDNAERHGHDGIIEAGEATAWIPAGESFWEFGVNQDSSRKASADYSARLSVPLETRLQSTYIQVTPRQWPGKVRWQEDRNRTGEWKEVRAYDASDLEQWLEQSIPAQIWLAEALELPFVGDGFETLDAFWARWRSVCTPALPADLFATTIEKQGQIFDDWISGPGSTPLVVAADSSGEALAFLACLLALRRSDASGAANASVKAAETALVFHAGDALRKLAAASTQFLPIAVTPAAEEDLASLGNHGHCVITRPRNAVSQEASIALELLTYDTFEKALSTVIPDRNQIGRLARESGYSPTILRRRLSHIPIIRTPEWARDTELARRLVPLALLGAWRASLEADVGVVSALAGRDYEHIETQIGRTRLDDDPPLWADGDYRGVTSKLDALFALAPSVIDRDLKRFFQVAESVLSERDPALDLPEEDRWLAAIYRKQRRHSPALRAGVCETLVLLSVYGNELFYRQTALNVSGEVSALVQRLLTPFTLETLLSQNHELPRYAEAAPDIFLNLLQMDLRRERVVVGLLKPVAPGSTAGPQRTGLLWALETVAWNPDYLPRVVSILGDLAETPIDDNWLNKPMASLQMILSSRMPQTAARLPLRQQALMALSKRNPTVGWRICVDQCAIGPWIGHYSHRPEWRNDATGFGEPVDEEEALAFRRTAIDIALGWPAHDEQTLGDLVQHLPGLDEGDAIRVWAAVDDWRITAPDHAKAQLRERIRLFALTRRGRRRDLPVDIRDRSRELYAVLTPQDVATRHAWLFAKAWVEESSEELDDDQLDRQARGRLIDEQRTRAMGEIWSSGGFALALSLAAKGEAPEQVGFYAGRTLSIVTDVVRCVRLGLTVSTVGRERLDRFMTGFLGGIRAEWRPTVLGDVLQSVTTDEAVRVLAWAPFDPSTWKLVAQGDEGLREAYWRTVPLRFLRFDAEELCEAVRSLIAAHRPRAAFNLAQYEWDQLETDLLKRLLFAVASDGAEPPGTFLLDPHAISNALESLHRREGVGREELARLEFLFLSALEHSEHGIPNLEQQVAESPMLFAQLVACAFKRSDNEEDPPELQPSSPEHGANLARTSHDLLRRLTRIPGSDGITADAAFLSNWVQETRRLCEQYARTVLGDQMLGQLLARGFGAEDTTQRRAVCEVMEKIGSEEMGSGFALGLLNSEGVAWRRDGGDRERKFAEHYRKLRDEIAFDYPFVSGILESVASDYEHRARREDTDASVSRRLRR